MYRSLHIRPGLSPSSLRCIVPSSMVSVQVSAWPARQDSRFETALRNVDVSASCKRSSPALQQGVAKQHAHSNQTSSEYEDSDYNLCVSEGTSALQAGLQVMWLVVGRHSIIVIVIQHQSSTTPWLPLSANVILLIINHEVLQSQQLFSQWLLLSCCLGFCC